MASRRKQLISLAASAAIAVGLAGCGGDDGGGDPAGDPQERSEATQGGTLNFLQFSVTEHTDPQRMYTGRDLSNFGRTVYRSLVSFPINEDDPAASTVPVPDLATDTGTPNEDATSWEFTLKDGVRWQDGSDVTCEDLKYGVSRTFATDIITGGPNYIIGYLDVPLDDEGSPIYNGPYEGEGQEGFDEAITCDDKTITYNFRKPFPDFPLAIAALRSFDPYKESEDEGEGSNLKIFSNGPYMIDGEWNLDTGGTLVRNPEWDVATDDTREANPDEIVFEIGIEPETIIDRLIADAGEDQTAIAATSVTPAQYPQIAGPVQDRSVLLQSPFTNYLVPNFNVVTNPDVRKALALATDRDAYSAALGGENASQPVTSIVSPDVPGYTENDGFGPVEGGDVEGARAALEASGEQIPFPIKLTYPTGSDASEAAFAALKEGYDAAGFETELEGLDPSGPYYDTIQNPGSDSSLIWGGWGADWPSISTVIPPLFDSRLNLTADSTGQDYGNYESDEANAAMDEAGAEPDLDAANELWAGVNDILTADTAYIPLDITSFYYLRGSRVENYVNTPATSGYPDLGVISVTE